VYTGDKFEAGLAFFADDLGRITRFSREPADLAAARRLSGQAAMPGMVNGHSQAWRRVLRGRAGPAGSAPLAAAAGRLGAPEIYDATRMAFAEMLLAGITCVGEFVTLERRPDGSPEPEPNRVGHEILKAARDTGIRLALFKVAAARTEPGPVDPVLSRSLTPAPDQFLRETDALRDLIARDFPGDGAWAGVAAYSLPSVPIDYLKAVATYAHTHRLRLHVPLSERPADNEACVAAHGRTPVALLAEHGLLDKRMTAVHALHLTDDEIKLLGTARATVCACPSSQAPGEGRGLRADRLLAAGAGVALGTGAQHQINLLAEARALEPQFRVGRAPRDDSGVTAALWMAATATGARALGAPSGALEVGRPADFFTVALYDPAFAGAGPESLLANLVSSLERRAVREVWIGARQVVVNGRHPFQGAIVSRFVELQQRLWGTSPAA
jgi:formimidoylglutamate deiminase